MQVTVQGCSANRLNEKITISFESPSAEEFRALRCSIEWSDINDSLVCDGLVNSLFCVCLRDCSTQKLLAFGRVIGDGALYFYIQDVMVAATHQGQGLGSVIMQEIEQYLDRVTQKGATVALLAAQGKESFYKKYGYKERSGNLLGLGMCKFI